MKECSKSIIRRQSDPNFLNRYFVGDGIDIGGAPDPLSLYREIFPRMGEVRIWDLADGDAQLMGSVADESFDFVHSSHCLEHLKDPGEGLANWFRILKPGGHLIVTVPDEDLYEQGVFPSTFNADHKWTLTIFKQQSWSAQSRNLLDMISDLGPSADVQKIELLTASYRYELPRFDQTLTPIGEAGIEFVLRKRPEDEVLFGGRRPRPGAVSQDEFTLLTGIRLRRRQAQAADAPLDRQLQDVLNAGIADHQAGDVAAAEAKYRTVLAAKADEPDALHLLGTCLYQGGDHAEAKALIERAISAKPDTPEFYNTLGIVMRDQGDRDGACKALARALRISPNYLEAYSNLGLTLTDMKQYDKAETVLRMAQTQQPDRPDIRNALGRALMLQGRLPDAVGEFHAALKTAPSHATALSNLGVALGLLGDRDGAGAAFERALAADPSHVDAHCSYGQHLLAGGEFKEGWAHHEWRLRRPNYHRRFDVPQWQGEALDGRTILIWCEQGLGDSIHFIRYAPMVAARGGRVIVECRPSLRRLFAEVDGVASVADVGAATACDFHVPLLSLPHIFNTTLDSIPAGAAYFPSPRAAAIDSVESACKVGLVWAGNPDNKRDRYRSRPLSDFAPLAALDGVALYGLQVGAVPDLPSESMQLTDLVADVRDLYDTAAILAGLDLLITVDTAAAHLAGAMGRPVWVILDQASDWRWLIDREDTPWYPTMRLFRRRDDWPSVFARIADELKAFAAA